MPTDSAKLHQVIISCVYVSHSPEDLLLSNWGTLLALQSYQLSVTRDEYLLSLQMQM